MTVASTPQLSTGLRIREHEPMSRHTNFRIGGPARYYVEARTPEDVRAAVDFARGANASWFVLGGGSNTLVSDVGFDGLVIQTAMRDVRIDGARVVAGAGAITAAVARQAGDAGLTGFEWAVSLPGTIGGAVRGNAGCFGGEMKDVVEHVRVFQVASRESPVVSMTNAECVFRYRHSIFKEHPEWIVLEATLSLRSGDPVASRAKMEEYLVRRKTKQPLERPSAGCLFTNVLEHELDEPTLARLDAVTDGAWHAVAHDGQIPTGWLVHHVGCAGLRVGNAMISEKHGNFVINLGSATAADVLTLADTVRSRVAETFGITLHEEVQRLGC
ncbi:UDP-N-acetylmuramate dehydrogenase [Candidatus Uhrbacteria bacterium]|nr:UDP-N-acetylmuramate dehydrogenase [Candidatus Uhrbacteria bacterium]